MLAAGVAIVAAIMLAIPLTRFDEPKPARFGWHMFSAAVLPPEFYVIDGNGGQEQVFANQYLSLVRGDLPVTQALPAHLCQQLDGVVAVIVRSEATEETIPCP